MIVVEGPDGAGKTSLMTRLAADIGELPILPRACTSEGGPIEDLCEWVQDDVLKPKRRGIMDRHPLISEPIYGTIIRGTPTGDFDFRAWYRTQMVRWSACEPIVIFCLPPLEVVRENLALDKTPQMAGVRENIDKLYWAYHYLVEWWPGRTLVWDYTQTDYYDIAFHITNHYDRLGV